MKKVKGIILAGGEGTRLHPLTKVTNKHLQRIGRKLMIDHPYEKLIEAGITDIHVIVGGENWAQVVKYLGSGKERGVNISYSIQDQAGGIAEALSLARVFAGNDKVCVILGDNLFDISLRSYIKVFSESPVESECYLFTKEVIDPQRFGVLYRDGDNPDSSPVDIIEKPVSPRSHEAVAGIYFYTHDVFDIIKTVRPSERGEMEISDVNRWYVKNSVCIPIKMSGRWTDCGTHETLKMAEAMYG